MSQVDLQLVSSNSPGSAFSLGMSADGRFVLVEETSTGVSDIGRVAVYDAQTGASQTVFLKEDGRVEFVDSAALSADGRYVAFELRSGGDNKIYRWDRVTGTTELVSETVEHGESSASKHPSISGDGRFVVFDSLAADLVPGDTAGTHDVFVADMQLGGIRRVYRGGTAADISANGQYAYVISDADGNGYRVNIQSGAVDLVGPVENSWIQASQNGDSVVFSTSRSLSPADADGVRDVYVKDFRTGITSLISTGTTNDAGGGASNGLGPQISADGKRVVFYSAENTTRELLASDVASGTLGRVSLLDFGGAPLVNGAPVTFGLSSDGLTVAFATAGSLVPSDSDNRQDVYLARYSRPTLSITSVSEDDRVNAAEEGQFVTVRGRSDAEGLQVVVTSPSGATATATVVGGIWTATVASSGVADGTRAFTAVVTDDAGVTNTASRSVLFDSVAPTLTFSLNNDATSIGLAQGPVSILHGTSDAIGLTVTIQVDGVTVATPTVQPPGPLGGPGSFSAAWTPTGLTEGQHALTFSVSDAAGNVTRNTLDFLYDVTTPRVAILSVAGDNVVGMAEAGKLVPVVGTSDEPFGLVEILLGGSVVGSTTTRADGTWQADVSVGSAPFNAVFTARVTDRVGNVGVDTENVLVNRDIIRVSVAADGSEAHDEYGGFHEASLSGDGHLATFLVSRYSDLGFADELGGNLWGPVVKNLDTGELTFVGPGYGAEISDDGSRVAYYDYTSATYRVRDLATGTTIPVNVTASGQAANADVTGMSLSISADGRYVVFASAATNLVAGLPARDPRYFNDRAFVKDLQTGAVSLVSFAEQDPQGGSSVTAPHIGGGRYVPFDTYLAGPGRDAQGNLLDANGNGDVYLRDLVTGAVTLVSATPTGTAGNGYSKFGEISPDGRYVAFWSRATDLVPGLAQEGPHAYLRDLQTGTTTLLSATQDGTPVLASSGPQMFTFSADARYVGLPLGESNSDSGPSREGVVYYVKDLQTGALTRASTGQQGEFTRDVTSGDISADGSMVVFASGATDLVPGDTNGQMDVFLRVLRTDGLVLDPIAGDDRIAPAERSSVQTISGSTTARGSVTVEVDGHAVATAVIGADGHWATTIDTSGILAGRHNVTATASAGHGLETSDGAILEVEAIPQVIGLSLAHDTGALANDYRTSDPTLAVTTSLPGDTVFFSTDNTTFSTRQPTFAADGSQTVYVRTVNDVGTVTGSANITFTLDRSADAGAPLTLTIDGTADGTIDRTEASRVSYEVSGLDADATAVATFTDGARSVTAAVQANGLFTVDLSALTGQVTSRVVATDLAGNAAIVTGNAVLVRDGPAAPDGQVLDGYLSGATVFADANGNRVLDGGEASTMTDSLGHFAGLVGSASIVATGGLDISTGLPFEGILLAPAGSSVVTPLTTLVAILGDTGVADAVRTVLAKLGLPAGYDLLHADPIAGSSLGDADARSVLVAGAEVQGTAALITAALVGSGQNSSVAALGAANAIAAVLGSHAALDLASVADLLAIASQAGIAGPAADAIAQIAAATNAGLKAGLDSPTLVADLGAVQMVVQGAAADAIEQAGSDPARLAAVVATYGAGVEPKNAAPVAFEDPVSTRAGSALPLAAATLTANDTDADGHALVLIGVKDALHGSVAFDAATGLVSFTPENGYTGQGAFTYTVADGHGGIADGHVQVHVASTQPDTTPPETTITAAPAAVSGSSEATFTFRGDDTGGSGVGAFEVRLDAGPFTAAAGPVTYTALEDGIHTFRARAIDAAGNVDTTPVLYTWRVDTTAPETAITSFVTRENSATFGFGGQDGNGSGVASYEVQFDAGFYAAAIGPATYTGLADGIHTFRVRAVDAAGNVDPSSVVYTWRVKTGETDTTAPETTINSFTATGTSATFGFVGNDGIGSGVASYQVQFDAGLYAAATGPGPVSYRDLAEGIHTFRVRAVDAAGNLDQTPAIYTFRIGAAAIDPSSPDTIAPETTITSFVTSAASATFDFRGDDGAGSGVASYQARLDTDTYAAAVGPVSYEDLAEGIHTFRVRAVDAAGNFDQTPATYTFRIGSIPPPDTAAPDTTITSFLARPAGAIFDFQGDDAGGSGVARYEVRLDAGIFTAAAGPVTYTGLADGIHTFRVRAVDAAGNVDDTPAIYTWRVDTSGADRTAPETTITTSPAAISTSSSATFAFSGDDAGGSGVARYEVRLDAEIFTAAAGPVTYTGLADGIHTFRVRAFDAAGNVDATPAIYTWRVDTSGADRTAPETTITTSPAAVSISSSATFAFSGDDAGGSGVARYEVRLDAGIFTAAAGPVTYTGLADGIHTFRVRAVDAAGNVDDTPAIYTWRVDTDAPGVSPGRVLDGYLSGATVFADANGNRMLDGGEASTTTDSLGNFAGLVGAGNLVAKGGVDISTELPFRGVLLAPSGSNVVTPLTTLAALFDLAGVADPVGMVLAKLGLPAGYDLLHADPIAGSALGSPDGRAVLVAGAEVQGIVALITAALVGAGQDAGTAAFLAADAFVAALGSHAAIDLTSVADVLEIASQAGVANPVADAVARVAAATNAGLEAALSSPMLIADVASVQTVIQGVAADMIEHAGSDPARLGAILAIYGVGVEPGNASPAALDDTASTRAGTALSLAGGTLLANDTDPDGHTLSLIGVKDASHGTVSFDPATGDVLFLPEAGFTGQGSFTYTVTDGHGGIADAHVVVIVDPLPTGSGWGDVHYVTYDGLRYDLQTTGDYLLTKARSGPDLAIEGRAEGEGGVSFLTAVTLAADGHNVSFDAASPNAITVDGTEVLIEVGQQLRIGSLTITEADADTYRVGTAAADIIEVIMRGDYLDIGVTPGSGRAAGSFEGLLGNFDGYAWNDLTLRDGGPIAQHDPALIESVYADSWRVAGPDTLLAHLGDAGLAERAGWHAASGEALPAMQDWLLA